MSVTPKSSATPTLQTVLEQVRAAQHLTDRQRQDRISAITSICKWLNRSPMEVPADPAWLGIAFADLSPASCGVSVGRFANVRSALKATLQDCGISELERRDRIAIAPQWKALLALVQSRYDRAGLTRFVRFLSVRNVSPEVVDDDAVEAYQSYLASNFKANAYKVTQRVVLTWNRLRAGGWPVPPLTPLKKFERYTLTWDQVPSSLLAEIEHWLSICAGEHPTDDRSPPRPLRPDTIEARRYLLLQYISGLHHQGFDVSSLQTLADLCDPERVKLSLQYHVARFRKRHGAGQLNARTPTLFGIADLPRQIAKHYLPADVKVVAQLTSLSRRFSPGPSAMCDTAERRLQQVEDRERLRELLRYPIVEMSKLSNTSPLRRRDASRFAALLAIALLTRTALRIKNIAALDLDRHLKIPPRRGEPIIGTVPRPEIKNGKPMKFAVTGVVADLLRHYVRWVRPLLLDAPSSALFPGAGGKPRNRKALGQQISGLLRREIGFEWSPHLFRHLAAYLLRMDGANNYVEAQLVLGHRSADTTRRSYEGWDAGPAFAKLDRLIDQKAGFSDRP